MNISTNIKDLRNNLIKVGDPNKYKLVNSFEKTSMAELQTKQTCFRVFDAVKEEKGRKLNIKKGFDRYIDSLIDYPSIIQSKLGGEWSQFNRMISIHIPSCPLNCWHCYVDKELLNQEKTDYFSAEKIVDFFIEQRDIDKKINVESNVLRITGGEPFLIPEMILEILEELKNRNLDGEIFVWTETNITPLSFAKDIIDWEDILSKLSGYSNFAVHPCFHGTSDDDIEKITRREGITVDNLMGGLRSLINKDIDIYPTVGSNVCDPNKLHILFKKLFRLRKDIPLRVALIEYDLNYTPLRNRLWDNKLYSKFQSLRIWNDLLRHHYGLDYGIVPRHLVNEKVLKNYPTDYIGSDSYNPKKELLFIFKSSYRKDYYREILDMMALPKEYIYKIEYDSRYLQEDLKHHMTMRPVNYQNREVMLFYADLVKKNLVPLRKMKISKIEIKQDIAVFYLKLGPYIHQLSVSDVANINTQIKELLGEKNIPPGNKYILLGEYVDTLLESAKYSDTTEAWREMIKLLHDMKCEDFETALFYKIDINAATLRDNFVNEPKSCFHIDGGKQFSITVHSYLPNYENFDRENLDMRKITYETSSEAIRAIGHNELYISKYGSELINFEAQPIANQNVETIISIKKPQKPFDAPMLHLPFEIKSLKGESGVMAALATLGMGFGGALFGMLSGFYKDGVFKGSAGHVIAIIIFALLCVGGGAFFKNKLIKYKVF